MPANTEILSSADIDLRELAADVVARAIKGGATAADAVVRDGAEFSTVVRMGEVETLKEAGSRGIGLRVFAGQHVGVSHARHGNVLVTFAAPVARIGKAHQFGRKLVTEISL